jgi:hypothetical protein
VVTGAALALYTDVGVSDESSESIQVLKFEPPDEDESLPTSYTVGSVVEWLVTATAQDTMPWPGVYVDVRVVDGEAVDVLGDALTDAGAEFERTAITYRYRVRRRA